MAFILKILATLVSLATTTLLLFESARRGLLLLSTVLGIIKIAIFVAFAGLVILVAYLVLKSPATGKINSSAPY